MNKEYDMRKGSGLPNEKGSHLNKLSVVSNKGVSAEQTVLSNEQVFSAKQRDEQKVSAVSIEPFVSVKCLHVLNEQGF